ncbi:MAG: acyl-CoA dehydrogenase C-terminal domain-containing protein, partial [Oligoflexales bacterium]|nr:acyl-CoA dehydrogenase C-terminal domain-containing protein [Oligoflexales bacterium]
EAEAGSLAEATRVVRRLLSLFGTWIKERKQEQLFSFATRFLEIMAEVTIGWLLLEAAVIADSELESKDEDSDRAVFLKGKIASARYFYGNIIPLLDAKAKVIELGNNEAVKADFW